MRVVSHESSLGARGDVSRDKALISRLAIAVSSVHVIGVELQLVSSSSPGL